MTNIFIVGLPKVSKSRGEQAPQTTNHNSNHSLWLGE